MKKTLATCTFALLTSINAFAANVTIDQKSSADNKTRFFEKDGKPVIEVTIKKGDNIIFHNGDSIDHNVYSFSEKNAFEILPQKPKGESKVQFKEAGITEVECAIHPTMKLKVKVQ